MARAAVARAAAFAGVASIRGAPAGAAAPARYPCGKLKPSHPPATIKRIVTSALQRGENPLLGTPLGWLHLHGELTLKQLTAGAEYAKLRTRYDRAMGLPRRSARSLGVEAEHGPAADGGWADGDIATVRRQFEPLRAALLAIPAVGVKIVSLLDDTCVDLQMPSWPQYALLRQGLDRIAEAFRMGERAA